MSRQTSDGVSRKRKQSSIGIADLESHLPVFEHRGDMQSCNLHRATVVKEYEDTSGIRMYCRVIGSWDNVLPSITRSYRERLK